MSSQLTGKAQVELVDVVHRIELDGGIEGFDAKAARRAQGREKVREARPFGAVEIHEFRARSAGHFPQYHDGLSVGPDHEVVERGRVFRGHSQQVLFRVVHEAWKKF